MAELEARAIISAEDRTDAAFLSVQGKIKGLEASVSGISSAISAVSDIAKTVAPASAEVGAAADAVNRVTAATRDLLAERSKLMSDLRAAGAGDDAVAAQERLRAKIAEVNKTIGEQGAAAAGVSRELAAAVAKEDEAQRRRAERWREAGYVLTLMGPVMLRGTQDIAKAGGESQHALIELRKAGATPEEIEAIDARTLELSARYGNVGQSELVAMAQQLRSIVTDQAQAAQILGAMAPAMSIMNARDPTGRSAQSLMALVRGAEGLGAAGDPDRLAKLIDAYVRAMQVSGAIDPEAILNMARRTRAEGGLLSDRFLTTTGPMLADMMGPRGVGGLAQFFQQITGRFQGAAGSLDEWVRMGLIPEADVERGKKTGEATKLREGAHPAWMERALSDPDRFIWEDVLPALAAKGITDKTAQAVELRQLFPQIAALDTVVKLAEGREQFEARSRQVGAATGIAGAGLNVQDAATEMAAFGAQVQNFAAAMSSPIMKPAGEALAWLAGQVGALAQALTALNKAHPGVAPWLSGGELAIGGGLGALLTYRLLGSLGSMLFGGGAMTASATALGGSAAALTAAATALDVAAGRLGASGPANAIKDLAPLAPAAGGGWWGALGGLAAMGGAMAMIAQLPMLTSPEEDAALKRMSDEEKRKGVHGWGWGATVAAAAGPSWQEIVDRDYRERNRNAPEDSPEARRAGAYHEMGERMVQLDPASKALVEVVLRIEDSGLLRVIADAVAQATGNLAASVGVSTAGVAPNGLGGIGHR